MKLLFDQGLPRNAAALLCQAGIDTVHVGDIGHNGIPQSLAQRRLQG